MRAISLMGRRIETSSGEVPERVRWRAPLRDASGEAVQADSIGMRQADGEILVGFRVSPSAKMTRILGHYGERIKVQVSAPPENDKANSELVAAVVGWLGLPPGCVDIRSGHKSQDKLLSFKGIEEARLRELLERLVDSTSRRQERGDHE